MQGGYSYEPFGYKVTSGATSTNPYQYTGRENDGGVGPFSTDLYYYRARYYSPVLQRFISQDPIDFQGSGPNLYAYVFNNPLSYTDPTGLINFLAGFGGSLEFGGGAEAEVGLLLNPGFGSDCFDIGFFGTVGAGIGVNVGADAFVGAIAGSASAVKGTTVGGSGAIGPVTGAIIQPKGQSAPSGGTIGLGVGPPLGASGNISTTGTITLNGLLRKLGFNRCGCKG